MNESLGTARGARPRGVRASALALSVLLPAFVLSGCGSDDGETGGGDATTTSGFASVDDLIDKACEEVNDLEAQLGSDVVGPRAAADHIAEFNELFQQAREIRPSDRGIKNASQASQVLASDFDPDFEGGFMEGSFWGGPEATEAGMFLSRDYCLRPGVTGG